MNNANYNTELKVVVQTRKIMQKTLFCEEKNFIRENFICNDNNHAVVYGIRTKVRWNGPNQKLLVK